MLKSQAGSLEHDAAEESGREQDVEALPGRLAELVAAHAAADRRQLRFAARRVTRREQRIAGGHAHARVQFLHRAPPAAPSGSPPDPRPHGTRASRDRSGSRRPADEAVLHAIPGVAGRDRRLLHERELRRRNERLRFPVHRLCVRRERGQQRGPVIRRRARDDAVEVLGEALRRDMRLAPALRAAIEIVPLRRLAEEPRDDAARDVRASRAPRDRPKSRTFSGWPIAQRPSTGLAWWPLSVAAVA